MLNPSRIFMNKKLSLLFVVLSIFSSSAFLSASNRSAKELNSYYEYNLNTSSDINEHLPHLRRLAKECSSVVEIGLRTMVSSWGILQGLSESSEANPSYLGIDIGQPPLFILAKAQKLAVVNGISFRFLQADDMTIQLEPTDMLFIDSLHTYCHLTYELEKFSPMVRKYIAMHDTSDPWGSRDDDVYYGNYSEYPPHINRMKRGLWEAVSDFLNSHPEWVVQERYFNNNGFTVLKRISDTNSNVTY